jgi:hypothetical protein
VCGSSTRVEVEVLVGGNLRSQDNNRKEATVSIDGTVVGRCSNRAGGLLGSGRLLSNVNCIEEVEQCLQTRYAVPASALADGELSLHVDTGRRLVFLAIGLPDSCPDEAQVQLFWDGELAAQVGPLRCPSQGGCTLSFDSVGGFCTLPTPFIYLPLDGATPNILPSTVTGVTGVGQPAAFGMTETGRRLCRCSHRCDRSGAACSIRDDGDWQASVSLATGSS